MPTPTNDAQHKAFHVSATELAEKAWDAVRGDDPAFKSCLSDFRGKLVFVTQTIIKTGRSGAVGLEAFEAEVARLSSEPEAVSEEPQAAEPEEAADEPAPSPSDDANTLRESEPGPDDDAPVSAAAKRLSKRRK